MDITQCESAGKKRVLTPEQKARKAELAREWRKANPDKARARDERSARRIKERIDADPNYAAKRASRKRRNAFDWQAANLERMRELRRGWRNRKSRAEGRPTRAQQAERRQQKQLADAAIRAEREQARQAERQSKPWNKPGMSDAEKFKIRYRLDPEFNLKQRMRAHFKRTRQGRKMGDILRAAVVRNGSCPQTEQFVGYTAKSLRIHLERMFTKGMTWERFCSGEIHIDHIIPLTAFDLSNPDELKAAWAITNLRPLWAKHNLAKRDRVETLL